MFVYILVNGRTRAICGVFSTRETAQKYAIECKIDSWHLVDRLLDARPVQLA